MHAEQASHAGTNQRASTTHDGNPRRDTRDSTHQTRDSTGNTHQPGHQIRHTTRLGIERRHIIVRTVRTLIRNGGIRRRLASQLIISQHCMFSHEQSFQSVENPTVVKPPLEFLHGHTRGRTDNTITRETVHFHQETVNELRAGIPRPIRDPETVRHPLHPITARSPLLQTGNILILDTPNLTGHDTIHRRAGNLLSPTHRQRTPRAIDFKLGHRPRGRLMRHRIRRSNQTTSQTIQTLQIIQARTLRVIAVTVTDQRQITILDTQITNQLRDRQIITIGLAWIAFNANTHVIALRMDAHTVTGMPCTIVRIHDASHTASLDHVMRGSTTRRTAQGIDHTLERRMSVRITPPVDDNILDPIRATTRIIRTIILGNIFI
nr:MAG TPA: hypothetical protein [Caudoviricetes sp.]